jgi:fatty-acyl-CoA synthase
MAGKLSVSATVVDAMTASAEVADQGFTFADVRGQENFMPFGELAKAAHRQAGVLHALGLEPGQRVVLIIPEQQAFVVTFLAALAARLVPVPMYPPTSLAKVENWRQTAEGILRVAGPAAIVAVDEVCPLLWSLPGRLDAKIITCRQLAAHPDAAFTAAPADPEDLAFLQFTSGSTMAPRGVMVSHRNITENCSRIMGDFLRPVEVTGVSWLPLYHDMGLIGFVLAPLLAQRPVVFMDTLAFLKRPALWFDLIHRHRATVTFAPQFAYALAVRRVAAADLARWDLSCLQVAGCGAEPIAAHTLRSFAEHFAPAGLRPEALCPSYGLAEATLLATCSPVGEHWRSQVIDAERLLSHGEAAPPGPGAQTAEFVSCGTVIAGHTLRIVDDRGQALPESRVGEIELEGPSVTGGYFADPGASEQTFVDGRLRTGDMGYVADGHLFVTGRSRDLVIVHGRNYAPQTIEWALDGLPSVRPGHAVAFGYPDKRGAEQVGVVCEAASHDVAAVAGAVAARISEELGLTVGEVLVVRPGLLPRTSSGKLQRARTRALFLDGTLRRTTKGRRTAALTRRWQITRLRWQAAAGSIRFRIYQGLQRRTHTGTKDTE